MEKKQTDPKKYLPLLLILLLVVFGLSIYEKNFNSLGSASGKKVPPAKPVTAPKLPFKPCDQDKKVRAALNKYFKKESLAYHLFKLSGPGLAQKLQTNKAIDLPILDPKGDVLVWNVRGAERAPEAQQGNVKQNPTAQAIMQTIPRAQVFEFGCNPNSPQCGNLTFLDPRKQYFEAVFSNPQIGLAAIESVDTLLLNLSKRKKIIDPNCSIVYNIATIGQLIDVDHFGENVDPEAEAAYVRDVLEPVREQIRQRLARDEMPKKTIPIVLDGDAKFYELDKDTVWTRQQAILLGVNLIYNWVEPRSAKKFAINFSIKGQEVWDTGFGPTADDNTVLTNQLNDPNYHMITRNDHDEVAYIFIGYDMKGGIAGEAGSVCNLPGYDEQGYGREGEQRLRAWGQQIPDTDRPDRSYAFSTFMGRMIVAAHEIGHLVGGVHESGAPSQCAGGAYPNLCGCTLMLSGAAGGVAPDYRQPFFSRENDDRVVACVFRN